MYVLNIYMHIQIYTYVNTHTQTHANTLKIAHTPKRMFHSCGINNKLFVYQTKKDFPWLRRVVTLSFSIILCVWVCVSILFPFSVSLCLCVSFFLSRFLLSCLLHTHCAGGVYGWALHALLFQSGMNLCVKISCACVWMFCVYVFVNVLCVCVRVNNLWLLFVCGF